MHAENVSKSAYRIEKKPPHYYKLFMGMEPPAAEGLSP